MFEKYQRGILRLSNSGSVATLEKEIGRDFPGFTWIFYKIHQESGILIKTG